MSDAFFMTLMYKVQAEALALNLLPEHCAP